MVYLKSKYVQSKNAIIKCYFREQRSQQIFNKKILFKVTKRKACDNPKSCDKQQVGDK